MRDTAAAVQLIVPADLHEVSAVRRRLNEMIREAGDSEAIAYDLVLVASELCTNVIQYAGTEEFTVSCSRDVEAWVLEVSHADGVDLDAPALDVPNPQGGRGLMIVRTVMDTVELVDRNGGRAIRCTKLVA